MRRGALMAFEKIASRFGAGLFDRVGRFWEGVSAPLVNAFDGMSTCVTMLMAGRSVEETDEYLSANTSSGQDVIDALTSLRLVAPSLDVSLYPRLITLFPFIVLALQSSYSLVRMTAAKCLAALCDVMTEEGMRRMVDDVVPLIGDARRVESRQGAIEAVHRMSLRFTRNMCRG
jgi:TATA-binding protein-associated factor